MATQVEVDAAWRRYGQWTSFVLMARENLAKAEAQLPGAPTALARALLQRVIDTNRKILAEMDALFSEPADAGSIPDAGGIPNAGSIPDAGQR